MCFRSYTLYLTILHVCSISIQNVISSMFPDYFNICYFFKIITHCDWFYQHVLSTGVIRISSIKQKHQSPLPTDEILPHLLMNYLNEIESNYNIPQRCMAVTNVKCCTHAQMIQNCIIRFQIDTLWVFRLQLEYKHITVMGQTMSTQSVEQSLLQDDHLAADEQTPLRNMLRQIYAAGIN